MSRENVLTLREQAETLIDALNARDFDAIAEMPFLDPNFEFHSAISGVEGEPYVGVSGLRDWAAATDAVWTTFRVEIIDFREVGDGRVVVIFRATGGARGSGVPLDTRTAQVWSLREGRLWRDQSYTDPQEALEAVGLLE